MKEIKLPYNCMTSIVANEIAMKLSQSYLNDKFYVFKSKEPKLLDFTVNDKNGLKEKKESVLIETWFKGNKL